MSGDLVIMSLAGLPVVKVLVDVLKISPVPTPGNLPAWLALAIGPPVQLLLLLYSGGVLNQQSLAGVMLAGLLSGGGAIGVVELGKRAD